MSSQVLDALVQSHRAEWTDKSKAKCLLWWRKLDDWAVALWQWADSLGHRGQVATLHEIMSE